MLRRLALLTTAAGTLLGLPAAAEAAITCQTDSVKRELTVTTTGDGLYATAKADGTLHVAGAPCASVPMSSIDTLVFKDASAGGTQLYLQVDQAAFAPGFSAEPFGASDLEVVFDAGAGTGDVLYVTGPATDDHWMAGAMAGGVVGVNLDVGTVFNDPDVTATGIEHLSLRPLDGDDEVDLRGGPGFTGPVGIRTFSEMGKGDDLVDGGTNMDDIWGEAGEDVLRGHKGSDFINPGADDDSADGGEGSDGIEYFNATAGVKVDLAVTAPQDTGGSGTDTLVAMERAKGSHHADVLTGTDGFNRLYGEGGDDVIDGRGGDDDLQGGQGTDTATYAGAPGAVSPALDTGKVLGAAGADTLQHFERLVGSPFDDLLTGDDGPNRIEGGAGADTIDARGGDDVLAVRDGAADQTTCGAGTDTATADHAGLDLLVDGCEQVDRSAAPVVDEQGPVGPVTPPVEHEQEPRGELPPPPVASLRLLADAKPRQRVGKRRVVVAVVCPDVACTAAVKVQVRLGRRTMRLRPVQRTLRRGRVAQVRVALPRKALRSVRKALGAKRRVTVRATVVGAAPGLAGAQAVTAARLVR